MRRADLEIWGAVEPVPSGFSTALARREPNAAKMAALQPELTAGAINSSAAALASAVQASVASALPNHHAATAGSAWRGVVGDREGQGVLGVLHHNTTRQSAVLGLNPTVPAAASSNLEANRGPAFGADAIA